MDLESGVTFPNFTSVLKETSQSLSIENGKKSFGKILTLVSKYRMTQEIHLI